jgi:hypothetical protein
MNIGTPIDWAATGQMLSGWGTFAGAAAVAFAAYKGADTFLSWKRQKRTERRMAVAEEILVVFYNFKRAFAHVRGIFHSNYDLHQAEKRLIDSGINTAIMLAEHLDRRKSAMVIISRFEEHEQTLQQTTRICPWPRLCSQMSGLILSPCGDRFF